MRRLFLAAFFVLAALSTAWADVHEFDPPGKPTDIDFAGDAGKDGPDPWLEAFLRRTWLDIWIELLRDEIFVDTSDSVAEVEFTNALRMLELSSPGSDQLSLLHDRAGGGGCQGGSQSSTVQCLIAAGLLSAGWTNPDWSWSSWSGDGPNATFGSVGSPSNGFSFGGFPRSTGTSWGPAPVLGCCDVGQGGGDDGAPPEGPWSSPAPHDSSFSDTPPSDPSGSNPLSLGDGLGGSSGGGTVPEPSTWVMLLIGACAIAFAKKIYASRRGRPDRPSDAVGSPQNPCS